jgi:hypothetical protein
MAQINNNHYEGIVVVSPMYDGEEKKDQDRAVWYGASQTACLCDAVTSSPYGVKAADLAIIFSLVLFSGGVKSILRTLCNLLIALRAEKLHSEIHLPNDTPAAMQPILQEVARRSIECSYQTTLVATKFIPQDGKVLVPVVLCGDSMFIAFDPNGQVLACSAEYQKSLQCPVNKAGLLQEASSSGGVTFGPGDEVLARSLGSLTGYPNIAEALQIRTEHRNKWLICQVMDKCRRRTTGEDLLQAHTLTLRYRERVIVPRYLAGRTIQIGCVNYVTFPYSRTIKRAKNPMQVTDFHHQGAATDVLPDHFYSGGWTYLQDRFPPDAEFILCSDGFYGCFKDPSELWSWLKEHQEEIRTPSKRDELTEGLHNRLRQQSSDDDISFVWVYPG